MIACRTPNRRSSTSATGVMQLVVQLAHEITCSPGGARFTPCTTVATVSVRAGADKITSRAPAARCLFRSSSRRKAPVHSSTRSTPRSFHGSSAGSRWASTGTARPPMTSESPAAVTVLCQRP